MRKSKYNSQVKPFFHDIKEWIINGYTDSMIAKKLGIALSTFYEYQQKYPEFSEHLTCAKKIDRFEALEKTLYQRAMGYSVTEKKTTVVNNGKIEETTFSKHIPADIGALKFVLTNKYPEFYKDKQTVDFGNNLEINFTQLEKDIL